MSMLQDFWSKTTSSVSKMMPSKSLTPQSGGSMFSTDPYLKQRPYIVVITQNQDYETLKQPLVVIGAVPQDFMMDQTVDWKAPWASGLSGTIGDLAAVAAGNRLVAQVLTMKVWQGSGDAFNFNLSFELRAYSDVERDVMNPLRNLFRMAVPSLDEIGFLKSPGPILDKEGMKELGLAIGTLGVTVAKEIGSAAVDASKAAYNGVTGNSTTVGTTRSSNPNSNNPSTYVAGETTDGNTNLVSAGNHVDNAKTAVGNSKLLFKDKVEGLMKNKISVHIGDWFAMDNVVITNVQHTMKPQMPGPKGGLMSANVTVSFSPMFAVTVEDIKDMLKGPQ